MRGEPETILENARTFGKQREVLHTLVILLFVDT